MRLQVLALGSRPPDWARVATADYCARVRPPYRLELSRIEGARRGRQWGPAQCMAAEARLLREATPAGSITVALDVAGSAWSTAELAQQLQAWSLGGQSLCFWIGGPDGLDPALLAEARWRWSLSRLTLPHALAQVLVAEQLYRAWSILQGLPYHRD